MLLQVQDTKANIHKLADTSVVRATDNTSICLI